MELLLGNEVLRGFARGVEDKAALVSEEAFSHTSVGVPLHNVFVQKLEVSITHVLLQPAKDISKLMFGS